mgnify:CR=1 FL=1
MTTWGGDEEVMGGVSERAALIPPDAAKPSLREWWANEVRAQSLRWRLWTPVAFGAGAAIYFALKIEPPLWPLLLVAGLLSGAWLAAKWRGAVRRVTLPLVLLASFALGVAVAKPRSCLFSTSHGADEQRGGYS